MGVWPGAFVRGAWLSAPHILCGPFQRYRKLACGAFQILCCSDTIVGSMLDTPRASQDSEGIGDETLSRIPVWMSFGVVDPHSS